VTGANCSSNGLRCCLSYYPVEFGSGTASEDNSVSGQQWLTCIVFAMHLLLIDEVIKFFMRRRRQ